MHGRVRDVSGGAIGATVAVGLTALSVLRYRNHWAGGLDLGLFDQAVWLLSHGRSAESTIVGGNIFGDHVSGILYAFVPLYWLKATPFWLLAAQATALGATVPPLRRSARSLGVPPLLTTVLTIGSAPLLTAAFYDFHPVVLATPGVAWLLVGVLEDRVPIVVAAGIWTVTCRADAGFVAFGLVLVASRRLWPWLAGIGVAGSLLALAVPAALGSESRQEFARYYGVLGDSPHDALLHPWRLFEAIGDPSTVRTLFIWLLPVLFLPILKPRWMAAVVISGLPLLLSTWPGVSEPWFHNAALIAPVVIVAAAAAVAAAPRDRRRLVATAGGTGLVLALALASPLSPRAPSGVRLWTFIRPNGAHVEETLRLVPDGVSVAATRVLVPPLAHRREIYELPCPIDALLREDRDLVASDTCGERRSTPQIVLADEERAATLRDVGYQVEPTPTPGIVIGRLGP